MRWDVITTNFAKEKSLWSGATMTFKLLYELQKQSDKIKQN